ncbi:hypothetical protein ACPC54_23795 [Kitasatospora sp. NPDC094028]
MTCPDDEWDGWEQEELLADLDLDAWEPLPPARPIRDVIRGLADYQPRNVSGHGGEQHEQQRGDVAAGRRSPPQRPDTLA